MKIIHLSDLHLGRCWYKKSDERFNRIVKHLKGDAFDGSELLIITGDLIESAERKGAMEHARNMIKPLEEKFENFLICPGNHDYGNFWGGRATHMKPFFEHFEGCLTSDDSKPCDIGRGAFDSPFPVVNKIDNTILIGLDTMEGEFRKDRKYRKRFRWNWGAEGELGCRQLKALDSLLKSYDKDQKVVVYLHHHPYKNMLIKNRFRDADAFNDTIRGKVNLILFGHNHKSANMEREARDNGVDMALEGGSIIGKDDIKFRVIDFSGEKPTFDEVVIACE
ncbi:metallophosphoesterase family protein [Pseudomonadota bacterium]